MISTLTIDEQAPTPTPQQAALAQFGAKFAEYQVGLTPAGIANNYIKWQKLPKEARKRGLIFAGRARLGKSFKLFGMTLQYLEYHKFTNPERAFRYKTAEDWYWLQHDFEDFDKHYDRDVLIERDKCLYASLIIIDDLNMNMSDFKVVVFTRLINEIICQNPLVRFLVASNNTPLEIRNTQQPGGNNELARLWGRLLENANLIGVE